jgi:hypothetical protein
MDVSGQRRDKCVFLVLAVAVLSLALPKTAYAEKRFKVGQVIIVGNTGTPDWAIRLLVPFQPGNIVSGVNLRRAESNLRRLGLFQIDQVKGICATVTVLEGEKDATHVDIPVWVKERTWNWLLFACWDLAAAKLTGDVERYYGAVHRIISEFADILAK